MFKSLPFSVNFSSHLIDFLFENFKWWSYKWKNYIASVRIKKSTSREYDLKNKVDEVCWCLINTHWLNLDFRTAILSNTLVVPNDSSLTLFFLSSFPFWSKLSSSRDSNPHSNPLFHDYYDIYYYQSRCFGDCKMWRKSSHCL